MASAMQARYVIYALLSMAYGVNIMQRNAINFLIPLIATELRRGGVKVSFEIRHLPFHLVLPLHELANTIGPLLI